MYKFYYYEISQKIKGITVTNTTSSFMEVEDIIRKSNTSEIVICSIDFKGREDISNLIGVLAVKKRKYELN